LYLKLFKAFLKFSNVGRIEVYGMNRIHPVEELKKEIQKVLEKTYGRENFLPTVKIWLPYKPPDSDCKSSKEDKPK